MDVTVGINKKHCYISDYVSIHNASGEVEKVVTCTDAECVVCDKNTYNFHVFPHDIQKRRQIVESFEAKRVAVFEYLEKCTVDIKIEKSFRNEYKEINIDKNENVDENIKIYLFKYGTTPKIIKQNYGVDIRNNGAINILYGFGKNGNINKFPGKYNNLYKYITVYYNEKWYTLNFMRLWYENNRDNEPIVHCEFNAFQYHVDASDIGYGLNKGKDKEFFDICYTTSHESGALNNNSNKNICYNPNIDFFKSSPQEILTDFFSFIIEKDLEK